MDDVSCDGVIGLDWRWWLRMAEDMEDAADGLGGLRVEEEGAEFRFGGRVNDVSLYGTL